MAATMLRTSSFIFSLVLTTTSFLIPTALSAGNNKKKPTTNPSKVPKQAVLLSQVSSLTLRSGKQTSSRRVNAVPQLQCTGPAEICKLYSVDVMRCTNEGADYEAEDIQWSCKASLPEEFKLGATEVICEGYESSEDPYILKGSCGVEYRLLLTEKGDAKYGRSTSQSKNSGFFSSSSGDNYESDYDNGEGGTTSTAAKFFFMAIFFAVLFIILRSIWTQWNDNNPQRRRPGTTYRPNGGGGGDGYDDPPPPYDGPPSSFRSTPPRKPKTQSSYTTAGSSSRTRQAQQGGGGTWRPGFWTGAATGAAAGGYLASRAQNRTQTQQQNRAAPANAAVNVNFGSSSPPSSSRHESTGFGGTQRR